MFLYRREMVLILKVTEQLNSSGCVEESMRLLEPLLFQRQTSPSRGSTHLHEPGYGDQVTAL